MKSKNKTIFSSSPFLCFLLVQWRLSAPLLLVRRLYMEIQQVLLRANVFTTTNSTFSFDFSFDVCGLSSEITIYYKKQQKKNKNKKYRERTQIYNQWSYFCTHKIYHYQSEYLEFFKLYYSQLSKSFCLIHNNLIPTKITYDILINTINNTLFTLNYCS